MKTLNTLILKKAIGHIKYYKTEGIDFVHSYHVLITFSDRPTEAPFEGRVFPDLKSARRAIAAFYAGDDTWQYNSTHNTITGFLDQSTGTPLAEKSIQQNIVAILNGSILRYEEEK